MSKLQNRWDKWLIKGWYGFKTMGWCYYMFSIECDEGLATKGVGIDFHKLNDFLVDNKIKRSTWTTKILGSDRLYEQLSEVRFVLAQESKTLSLVLNSKHLNRIEILLDIDNYKWRKYRKASKEAQRKKYKGKAESACIEIKARTLGDAQWGHVK